MRDMFTKKPDEGCREVEAGIFARPVQTSEESKMLKLGWSYSINAQRGTSDVREEKEGREEAEEEVGDSFTLKDMAGYASQIAKRQAFKEDDEELAAKYEEVIGKKPHHKMKPDTMKAKIDEALSND